MPDYRNTNSQPWGNAKYGNASESLQTTQTITTSELTPFGYIFVGVVAGLVLFVIIFVALVGIIGPGFQLAHAYIDPGVVWRMSLLIAIIISVIITIPYILLVSGWSLVGAKKDLTRPDIRIPTPQNILMQPQQIRLEVKGERRVTFWDLPINQEQAQMIATLALAGRLTERGVSGVISSGEWEQFKVRLLDEGYIEWKNPKSPKSGLLVTPAGAEFFEKIKALPAPEVMSN